MRTVAKVFTPVVRATSRGRRCAFAAAFTAAVAVFPAHGISDPASHVDVANTVYRRATEAGDPEDRRPGAERLEAAIQDVAEDIANGSEAVKKVRESIRAFQSLAGDSGANAVKAKYLDGKFIESGKAALALAAAAKEPADAGRAQLLAGDSERAEQKDEAAEKSFASAASQLPETQLSEWAEANSKWADAMYRLERYDEAIGLAKTTLEHCNEEARANETAKSPGTGEGKSLVKSARVEATIHLGRLLRARGKIIQAEPLFRQALEFDEQAAGKGSPAVAADLERLAGVLEEEGQMEDAEPLLHRALEIDAHLYGEANARVLRDTETLAGLLQAEEKLPQAEELLRRVVQAERKTLGPENDKLVATEENLAKLLQDERKPGEAEPLLREILQAGRTSLPPNDPELSLRMNDLATLLEAEGKLDEAEPLYREALEAGRKTQGADDPEVAGRITNLGIFLQRQKKYPEAEALDREALAQREQRFTAPNANLARAQGNLGAVLFLEGRHIEAGQLLEKALENALKTVGEKGPLTARIEYWLARSQAGLGKNAEALAMAEKAAALSVAAFGEEDERTKDARAFLKETKEAQ